MKDLFLFEDLSHFKRKVILDTKLAISIQSKTLIMGELIHDAWTGTLPKSAHDKRAHLTASEVSFVRDASRTKHTRKIVRRYWECRQRQSPRRFKITSLQRGLQLRLTTVGRRDDEGFNTMQTAKKFRRLCESNCTLKTISRTYSTRFFNIWKPSHSSAKAISDNRAKSECPDNYEPPEKEPPTG